MEIVRGDDEAGRPLPSGRRARLIKTARRSRQVAICVAILGASLFVLAVIAAAFFNFSSDPTYIDPNASGGYKFWNFIQSIAYSGGFLLAATVAAMWLMLHAERTLMEVDELDEAEARRHAAAHDDALVVDLERVPAPMLPAQGSSDDSLWRPPDLEPTDNPWQRT